MTNSRCTCRRNLPRLLAALVLITGLSACGSFEPVPLSQIDYLSRAQSQQKSGVTVTASVVSREEARQAFGKKLDQLGIQPVWIKIENNSDRSYRLLLHGVDPDYYSEGEAAAAVMSGSRRNREKIGDHFYQMGIDPFAPSGHTTSGFVFSHLKQGVKQVRVRLLGERDMLEFEFFVEVPGIRADWQRNYSSSVYAEEDIIDFQDPREFREMLEKFICCTTRKNGTGQGDPINLVVVAESHKLKSFITAGWDETEVMGFGSGWRTFKAFLSGGEYKNSPISALYIFERPQDISLQKARDTIHERNHLRLWLAPWRYRGEPVWIGSITRDIGVFFTTRTWNLTTHAIDSQVDEARSYVLEDLATAQTVSAFTLVHGVGISTPDDDRENLLGTPWWTDGRRALMFLSEEKVPLQDVKILDWGRVISH